MLKKLYETYYLNKRIDRINQNTVKEWYELSETLKDKKEINDIILGSSHGAYGLISSVIFNNETTINLCTDSQDLYRSYKILKKCLEKNAIKNIVLTFSLFSNSFMLDLVKSERDKCYLNEIIFNIQNRYQDSRYDKKYKKLIKLYMKYYLTNKYFGRNYRDCNGDKIGKRIFFSNNINVETRVSGHIKHNKRNINELIWLNKIIDLCKQRNINIVIVVMPVREDYRAEAFKHGSYKELFNDLIQICSQNNIKLLSYFNENIEDKYFGDFDHLTHDGALIISKKIAEDMCFGEIK